METMGTLTIKIVAVSNVIDGIAAYKRVRVQIVDCITHRQAELYVHDHRHATGLVNGMYSYYWQEDKIIL